jgi:hypothetical protein
MQDKERILSELKTNASDPNCERQLGRLCEELLTVFETKSAQGVTSYLAATMANLSTAFTDAHSVALRKLGATQDPYRQ